MQKSAFRVAPTPIFDHVVITFFNVSLVVFTGGRGRITIVKRGLLPHFGWCSATIARSSDQSQRSRHWGHCVGLFWRLLFSLDTTKSLKRRIYFCLRFFQFPYVGFDVRSEAVLVLIILGFGGSCVSRKRFWTLPEAAENGLGLVQTVIYRFQRLRN